MAEVSAPSKNLSARTAAVFIVLLVRQLWSRPGWKDGHAPPPVGGRGPTVFPTVALQHQLASLQLNTGALLATVNASSPDRALQTPAASGTVPCHPPWLNLEASLAPPQIQ